MFQPPSAGAGATAGVSIYSFYMNKIVIRGEYYIHFWINYCHKSPPAGDAAAGSAGFSSFVTIEYQFNLSFQLNDYW